MSEYKTKLLLILSVILVSLFSNISSNPFIELENKGSINHDTTLAYALPDPSRNNTDIQSTTSPIYKTNNSSSNVLALVHKGSTLSNQGNYTEAIPYFDRALEIDPNNKFAFDGKGNALYGLGNDTQAIQYFDKALAVDPNFKQALYDKGFTLYGLDNYTQAIKYYNKALSIDPNYIDALNGRQDAISQKVASAPLSGYSRGCSDSQIYDPADRYINQAGMGPSFHSKQFMQAYNEGYNACSNNLDSQSKNSSNSGDQFTVQKPYWISHDIYRPNYTNIAVFMDEVDTSHNVTYAEICMPTIDPAKPDCHIEKDKTHLDVLMVCLNSEVAKITHRICHNIDTAKELQKSGQGNTGTVNVGVFVFPAAMIQDYKKIEGCIYVSDVSSCDRNVYDTGHGLVMHLDTHSAYNNYYDYYSDY